MLKKIGLLTMLGISMIVASCSSYNFSVKSIQYRKSARDVKSIFILPVKGGNSILNEDLSKDFTNFLTFSLEKKGLVVLKDKKSNPDLYLSLVMKSSQISSGIEERHSVFFDVHLRDKKNAVIHILGIYESEERLSPGILLQKVSEKMADEIYERTRN